MCVHDRWTRRVSESDWRRTCEYTTGGERNTVVRDAELLLPSMEGGHGSGSDRAEILMTNLSYIYR